MKTQSDDTNLLIIRYLDGSATPDEKRALLRWLKQSESNRSDFSGTRDLWLACTAAGETDLEVDVALEKLRARLQDGARKKRTFGFRYWRTVGAAAVVLLLVGIGYGLGAFHFRPATGIPMQSQLITAKGSKGKFTLPDGTTVWLNSASKLVYPAEFEGGKREVTLDGGAYFEVVKNERKPFVVRTGEVCVEVLGTCFNVNAYAGGSAIETALLSGSVRISGEGMAADIRLHPGELFSYTRQTGETEVRKVSADRYADWTKERLTFDNDRLSDILVSMEGWYRVRIKCPETFAASTRMSFTIRQETIEEILQAMSYIAPLRYEIKEREVLIRPK